MSSSSESPFEKIFVALRDVPAWMAQQPDNAMGTVVIQSRQVVDMVEGVAAEALRRFEKSGAYKADGALGVVPWLRDKGKLNGGAAAERVEMARQLGSLPKTEEALARGEIGYQHAVAMARTAEHVGAAAVRKGEAKLLEAAQAMDPGQFVTVAKNFEHQVDRDAALDEANRAYQRRYLSIGEPVNGLARIEGQLVPEAAAIVRTAIEPYLKPRKADERSGGQRAHDALIDALRPGMGRASGAGRASDGANGATANGGANGSGPRPLMIIKTTVDTLAGIDGAPAGQLEWGGTVPAETVRRLACDSAISRIIGRGELEYETTHATRTIPPSTRRALVARDGHCVFPGCDRPAPWCEGHHLVFWADGGPTKIDNLGLVCNAHHRKVHEDGWRLERKNDRWVATPPALEVMPRARSA
ncbi:MAG TPA: DUF222 domain-containing protein [Candidatus Dormibacteraeota bacterium]|nr:DUF222 domain-containing protein [Candidatus Dormibacteraeota bacterium]